MKKIIKIILFPIITLIKGFNYFTKVISKGFYFYFATMIKLLNLLNKTAFGSISSLFTDRWFSTSNHKIMVLT